MAEWSKATDCKSVSYTHVGSNPTFFNILKFQEKHFNYRLLSKLSGIITLDKFSIRICKVRYRNMLKKKISESPIVEKLYLTSRKYTLTLVEDSFYRNLADYYLILKIRNKAKEKREREEQEKKEQEREEKLRHSGDEIPKILLEPKIEEKKKTPVLVFVRMIFGPFRVRPLYIFERFKVCKSYAYLVNYMFDKNFIDKRN